MYSWWSAVGTETLVYSSHSPLEIVWEAGHIQSVLCMIAWMPMLEVE